MFNVVLNDYIAFVVIVNMEHGVVDSCPDALHGSASTLFLTLINALITSKCSFLPENHYKSDYGPKLQEGDRFDFIVVGAGSGGSVVASRLSENRKWRVLLIEAGSYPSPTSEIPLLLFQLQNTTENWQYTYESSDYVRLKKKMNCPRGKGLGGSSLLNYMMYFRGNRYDYDSWAQSGNDGWDYESVLPLYKKFENLHVQDNHRFGKTGELHLTKFPSTDPVTLKMKDAYKELGRDSDYDEDKPLGTTSGTFAIWNGRRYNSAKAFVGKTVKNRSNLYVALNSQVSKLLISDTLTVEGVELQLQGKIIKIYSNKEVILSAGTINTPQILMNSGIGPKQHLESLGIKVLKDLKVGENLQDHTAMFGMFYKLDSSLVPLSPQNTMDSIYNFFMHGKGGLSEMGINFVGFVNPKNNSKVPVVQLYHTTYPQNSFPRYYTNVLSNVFNMPKNVVNAATEANIMGPIAETVIALSYQKSTGKVLLKSNNPLDPPLIYPNYLSNIDDVDSILEGIRFVQKLMKTESLKNYNPEFVKFEMTECQNFEFDSDEYWKCAARSLVHSGFHLVGTCKMGPKNDPDAVVDSRLRVYGIKRVRVIDGSIMPTIVGVNTNGAILLIGEKGSQMILEDWETRKEEL